jgi:hypothetical protein
MAINGHAALMGNQEGEGFTEKKRPIDDGRVKRSFTAALRRGLKAGERGNRPVTADGHEGEAQLTRGGR